MKRTLLILTLCGLTLIAKSQNTSVEQSTFGLQTGVLGIWAYNEVKLSNSIALRTELGFDFGIWETTYYDDYNSPFILTPVIVVEPRFYYNLKKRSKNSKRIDGNSGNFIALKTSYHPDLALFNTDDAPVVSDFAIIPTWGIRRNLGEHFNYEAGIGIGYSFTFAKRAGYSEDKGGLEPNMHLRIGYKF
ncbi:hypothetical protein MATR_10680 [Marivirga tractuosa]|uniref:Secreted protein n=1 Tax=Marivirga tractuosa (strain ATCC 23168 / DSM 4126 / NBRC 15989 / NCIMB 1408 / VKM B-1430 / H-43) TaxID=643867 RepID=E4TLI2_MARTH|nr:hypothetical protein [Marivirga tractuosa]ADR21303.1 hypothetical protein Ftrac_1313 [Marivirga tractuosa DSM 4126]BDD14243.1 hypothetical protein MATR_10680 [Marivirga tractuosa]